MAKQKPLRNVTYLAIDQENRTIVKDTVMYADESAVETKNYVLETTELDAYTDTQGHVYYINKLDYANLKESSNLKNLRRSMAIQNIFKYDTKPPLDIMSLLPWFIMALLIFFK